MIILGILLGLVMLFVAGMDLMGGAPCNFIDESDFFDDDDDLFDDDDDLF